MRHHVSSSRDILQPSRTRLSTAGPLMGQNEPHALGMALLTNRLRSSGSPEPYFLAMVQADAQLKET